MAPPQIAPADAPVGCRLRSSTRLLLIGCFLVGLTGSAPAQTAPVVPAGDDAFLLACQQTVACKTHLDTATQLYGQERYGGAIDEYQAAYVLQPYPLILYNIARLHHKQSQVGEAITYYRRYLDTAHPTQAERAKQLLAEAQAELVAKDNKPPPTPIPPAVALAPAAALSPPLLPSVRPVKTPIYKKWWFGVVIGVTVVGIVTAAGIGIYASGPDVSGVPTLSLRFGK